MLFGLSRSGELAVGVGPSVEDFLVRGTLARLNLGGGAPRELLEDVTAADWSPDGRLAAVRSAGGRTRLEFPIGTVVYETAGWISSPRFAPAGDAIAFHEHPLHGDDRGWPALVDLRSGTKRNLASEFDSLSGLAWRPGGSEVCFASSQSVRCLAPGGGPARLVLSGLHSLVLEDISVDGRLLVTPTTGKGGVIASTGAGEVDLSGVFSNPIDVDVVSRALLFGAPDYGIYLRRPDGSPAVRLGEGIPAGLSPDGKHVLAIVPGDPTELAVLPTGPGETRKLPRGTIVHHGWAAWMPDGRRVVVSGAEPARGTRLYLQEIEGGEPRPLTGEGVRLAPYVARTVSPDGLWVTAIGPDQKHARYPIEGGEPQPIPGLGDDLIPLSWTDRPDRLFARPRGEGRICPVYRIDVSTGERQVWRELGPSDPTGSPRVGIITLSPDGRVYAYGYGRSDSDLFLVSGVFEGRKDAP